MKGTIERFKEFYKESRNRSFAYNEQHIVKIGYLAPALLLAVIFDYRVGNTEFNTLWLRLLGCLLMIPMIFRRHALFRNLAYWPDYWIFACTFVFPFGFGLMLFLNAAMADPGKSVDLFWIIQYFIAVFLFIQLISNVGLTLLLWITATILCVSSLLFVSDPNYQAIREAIVYPGSAYLTAIILGSLFNRNSEIVSVAKIQTAASIGANIAHELRTPLAAIRGFANGLEKHLPALIDGYQEASKHNLIENKLSAGQIQQLRDALESIGQEVQYSNTIIDMLLVATAERSFAAHADKPSSAQRCAREAMERFPFSNDMERSMVRMELHQDFDIDAPDLIITHMLFNLIKNAIRHAMPSRAQQIRIIVGGAEGARSIAVWDSGSGIPARVQRQIFERFFTTQTNGQGTGIGLSFCRMAMEAIGGDITCRSDEHSFTEFVLRFPA